MIPADDELRAVFREGTTPSSRDACVTSEQIAALALEGKGSESVTRHIALCAACADEVRAVELAARSTVRPREVAVSSESILQPLLIAALLVITIALGGWVWVLRDAARDLEGRLVVAQRTVAQQSIVPDQPRSAAIVAAPIDTPRAHINVPVVDLEPAGTLRGAAGAAVIELPSAAAYTLILYIDPQRQHDDYEIVIVDRQDKPVWQSRGFRRSPRDTFTLTIERKLLSAGFYRVELRAIDGDITTPLHSYNIRIPER